jgi:8-oxo-dGTP pyrophosphatase MutT (NUDIX family)
VETRHNAAMNDRAAVVRQAGAIVFREEGGIARVLLARPKKDPTLWVFPKGHIEPGEAPRIAALREAFEEAGVAGVITGPAGPTLTFRAGDETVAVEYFLVRLTAEMPSPEGREKVWLLPEEAEQRLVFENARQLLRTATAKWQDGTP